MYTPMVRYNHGLACIPGTARLSSCCFRGKHRVLGVGGPRYDVAGSDQLSHVCISILSCCVVCPNQRLLGSSQLPSY